MLLFLSSELASERCLFNKTVVNLATSQRLHVDLLAGSGFMCFSVPETVTVLSTCLTPTLNSEPSGIAYAIMSRCICIYIYIYVYIYMHVFPTCTYPSICISMCLTYVYLTYVYVYTNAYTHTYMYNFIYRYFCICKYIYIYIYVRGHDRRPTSVMLPMRKTRGASSRMARRVAGSLVPEMGERDSCLLQGTA